MNFIIVEFFLLFGEKTKIRILIQYSNFSVKMLINDESIFEGRIVLTNLIWILFYKVTIV